jgi:D-glycero-D-manno-heptose 1,7-bisphosphate phosphatase
VKRPAVFLDRDGTLIREAEYLADPAGVEVLPGAVLGLRALRVAGYALVVVSNQSGVARGLFDEAAVRAVNARMETLLAVGHARPDAVYYCPHHPRGTVPEYTRECECRKPAPGMLQAAARDLDLDLAASWVVGDKDLDIELGKRLGLHTALVLTGYGAETRARGFAPGREPDVVAPDLEAASRAILGWTKE